MIKGTLNKFLRLLLPILLGMQQVHFAQADGLELIMFEENGCQWCEKWNEEIAPIYPKTTEGKLAPLKRLNIHDDLGSPYDEIEGLYFTPTFVLVENGVELGRITGYPGEFFFWPLLSDIFENHKATE